VLIVVETLVRNDLNNRKGGIAKHSDRQLPSLEKFLCQNAIPIEKAIVQGSGEVRRGADDMNPNAGPLPGGFDHTGELAN
jgi:hypothetical protein